MDADNRPSVRDARDDETGRLSGDLIDADLDYIAVDEVEATPARIKATGSGKLKPSGAATAK